MAKSSEATSFRASATLVYRIVVGASVSLVIFAGCLGWHLGGWLWLGIGLIAATVVAAMILFAATLLYAMSQDGG